MTRLTKRRLSVGGLVLSCIFLAGFIASWNGHCGYNGRTIYIGCAWCSLVVGFASPTLAPGAVCSSEPAIPPVLWPIRVPSAIWIPLWMPFLALGVPSFIVWRRTRRPRAGHCVNCGYDLTGNTSGVCPECGTEVESP